ncbi:hypothetical protein B0T25DRAFT_266231 [Lasiosphaeria hispida]|uniref:Uncharacterized protein n=1 Tax=Lasiosphaeria hispida TaxID=260671 RepID=A0AAJ0HAG1_9PEZI|nr:hypothetical protein B0T25DRAFT_266231 [Lasiosphaeria hispida]
MMEAKGESEPLLPAPSSPLEPLSYIYHDQMITRKLAAWCVGLDEHQAELQGWMVTKLEHMKSFHFSGVLHEYLRVTVKQEDEMVPYPSSIKSKEPNYIFVERMIEGDEVTVGWKKVPHPPLTGWWIKRLMLGYFGDARRFSSSVAGWKAVGYSASDYLRHLDFPHPGVPLHEFARVLEEKSAMKSGYNVMTANCFWFASSVYDKMKTKPCSEETGIYYKHTGKFAGLSTQLVGLYLIKPV